MLIALEIDDAHGCDVEGDEVVRPEEGIQFLEHQGVGAFFDVRESEDDVQVLVPVVHLGDVSLLERVLDRKLVELEIPC